MNRLRCVSRYVNEPRQLAWNAGEIFQADDALAAFLFVDAPGCFERVTDGKALAGPAADKAIKTPDKTK